MNVAIYELNKILQVGGKSKYVYLMQIKDPRLISPEYPKFIIKKAYDKTNPEQKKRFQTEIRIMLHLKGCDFTPKLLQFNRQTGEIYMSYVGTPLNKNIHKAALGKRMKQLHLEWNVLRHRHNKPNYSVYIGNGTILNNKIYVIDFGSKHYKIIGPPPKPK